MSNKTNSLNDTHAHATLRTKILSTRLATPKPSEHRSVRSKLFDNKTTAIPTEHIFHN